MARTLMRTFLILLALTLPAPAADYFITFNDAEKKALLELIDAAVRANGLGAAGNAVYLAHKINTAGTVVPPEDPPK